MRLRPPVLDDAPAVLGVLVARDVADLGAPDGTIGDLLDEWRAVDVDRDADSLHAVDAAAFASRPDYVPETAAEFREEHLEAHDFEPRFSAVAHEAGSIVGFLLARRCEEEEVGYVDLLGVEPRYQGRGLGTALLTRAFAAFAVAGLREAQLGVDSDNRDALRVYERAGMRVRFQIDIYDRPVLHT